MPSGPVVITYGNGELTIQALNSRLEDVLRAVSRETGALIEIPGEAKERVFGEFGPGPVASVLASLLNGSHFNYVMVGRSDNLHALAHVILTSKPADPGSRNKQVQAHNRRAEAVAVDVNSSQTQPLQPVPEQAQAMPAPSSVVPPDPQNTNANLMDVLTAELGPEAANMDSEQRRALEAMLAQMKRRDGQDSGTAAAGPNGNASSPLPFRKRRPPTRSKTNEVMDLSQ
jgi:hypothetical protein